MFLSKLKALVKIIPQTASEEPEDNDDPCCSICLAPLKTNHKLGCLSTPCAHTFHTKCLFKWLDRSSESSCAMCRAPIQEADLVTWPEGNSAVKIIKRYRSGFTYHFTRLRTFFRQLSTIREEAGELWVAMRLNRRIERQRQEEMRRAHRINEMRRRQEEHRQFREQRYRNMVQSYKERKEYKVCTQTEQRQLVEIHRDYSEELRRELEKVRREENRTTTIQALEQSLQNVMRQLEVDERELEKVMMRRNNTDPILPFAPPFSKTSLFPLSSISFDTDDFQICDCNWK